MKTIKIFGLRRSGTNYLAKLLENNLNCEVLIHAGKSKHDFPEIITNDVTKKINSNEKSYYVTNGGMSKEVGNKDKINFSELDKELKKWNMMNGNFLH